MSRCSMKFFYTYVLLCADNKHYIGYTDNVVRRLKEHQEGVTASTKPRRPVTLIYYEACRSKTAAMERERYFKTGFGRGFLKKRLSE